MCNIVSHVPLVSGDVIAFWTFWMPPLSMVSKPHRKVLLINITLIFIHGKKEGIRLRGKQFNILKKPLKLKTKYVHYKSSALILHFYIV